MHIFLSHDCTICYPFWDKNTIEIKHTNFNQAAFFMNQVVKLTATIQPCPLQISIQAHSQTHQGGHHLTLGSSLLSQNKELNFFPTGLPIFETP